VTHLMLSEDELIRIIRRAVKSRGRARPACGMTMRRVMTLAVVCGMIKELAARHK